MVIKVYMKLPADCTVTYTDGVDDEVLFEDQSYTVKEGSETPAFSGTPTRENWVFTGWSPAVSDTVTGDVTYVAQWEKGTANKPRKGVTATDVSKMEIRFYGTGTEVLNPNDEPYSLGGTSGKVGADNVAYEIGDIYGNDVDGYFIDIDFHFAHGDKMEANGRDAFNRHSVLKNYPEWQGNWVYDFSKCDADQTLTLIYSTSRNEWVVPGGSNNMTSAVANVIKVYMKITPYTVTYTDGVADEEIFADESYTVGEGSLTPAFSGTPEREGYTFVGWDKTVADVVTENVTYTAVWTANTYTLTLDAGEGTVDPATATVTYDAAVGELPVPTRDGYEFAGWTDENGTIVTADTVYTVAGDSTLTAQWEKLPDTTDPENPGDTQNPGDDTQKPGDGTQKPGDGTQTPGGNTQKPGDTENVGDNDVPQAGADDTTSNTPQTGDESSLALLLTMLLASAAGFGVMGLRRREEK